MEWTEISVGVDNEAVEAVSAFLSGFGPVAVEEVRATPTGGDSHAPVITVRCYVTSRDLEKSRDAIHQGLWHLSRLLPIAEPRFRTLTERDWMEAWREHYPVIHIGSRIVIVPAWRRYEPQDGEVVLVVDPGMAFGTGLHPSTQLCLAALETYLRPGDSALDVGTGTGILSIAAAKLGAGAIVAMDIESAAVEAATANVAANGLAERVDIRLASVVPVRGPWGSTPDVIDSGTYDLLLVNIIAEVIAEMAPVLLRLARPGGTIITSGIIAEREHLVEGAFSGRAEVIDRRQDGDWVSITYRVPG